MHVWRHEQAQLLTINDNGGHLFDMYQHSDRSVIVPLTAEVPTGMTKIASAAIGFRVTDAGSCCYRTPARRGVVATGGSSLSLRTSGHHVARGRTSARRSVPPDIEPSEPLWEFNPGEWVRCEPRPSMPQTPWRMGLATQ